ncbi:hypothetical protein [Streptomyces sp. NPDC000133]|uniref:hypothetical protein n=1 Tax=Streptomyces sp. NPDC000133 TaxID=3364535 RepID=UPI0036BA4575
MDTIHVIDGSDSDGAPQSVVVLVRWKFLDESETATTVIRPNADGLYAIGGYEWTWYQVEDGPMETARRDADRARARVLNEGVRLAGEILRELVPDATVAGVLITDGHPRLISVANHSEIVRRDDDTDEGPVRLRADRGADTALLKALQYGTSPEALQSGGWNVLQNEQGLEAYEITFPPAVPQK